MTPEEAYRYSPSQLAQYYGITAKGLAFYEQKGILSPQRTANGKYREFSLADCYHLYDTKLYSNCGFSLSETADLIQHGTLASVGEALARKSEEMAAAIRYQELLRARIDRLRALLEELPQRLGRFTVEESPEMVRLFVRRYFDPHDSTPQQAREFARWNGDIPIDVASLQYDFRQLLAEQQELNVEIGNIILAEDFAALGYEGSSRTQRLPPRRCLHTILPVEEERLYRPDWLRPALEELSRRGLTLSGDPVTAMVLVTGTPTGRQRFDEVWLPID